ncbi:phosphosulfolactate synthase [Hoeflea sp. TYP-13]|uniref:phosphosulfolactate synthase n=1 Tax=Hoeflea sp. TYP-13 TaxID=3230023 RepID=UPI0034C5F6D0
MLADPRPSFLKLKKRPPKPRSVGLTHVLDKGYTLSMTQEVLAQAADFIDIWKFGWGTSYVDPAVRSKVAELQAAGIKTCTGGTLLEVAWMQGQTEAMFQFASEVGFDCVEVSDGATEMPPSEKRKLISRACDYGFDVMAEVGSKDPAKLVTPAGWLDEIDGDVAAGASWIVAEGRESGTVGLYEGTGEVRRSLIDMLGQSPHADKIIYEAPQRAQQSFLLRLFGPKVNLGNISIDDIMSLETLRLGLRADTLGLLSGDDRGSDVRI